MRRNAIGLRHSCCLEEHLGSGKIECFVDQTCEESAAEFQPHGGYNHEPKLSRRCQDPPQTYNPYIPTTNISMLLLNVAGGATATV